MISYSEEMQMMLFIDEKLVMEHIIAVIRIHKYNLTTAKHDSYIHIPKYFRN